MAKNDVKDFDAEANSEKTNEEIALRRAKSGEDLSFAALKVKMTESEFKNKFGDQLKAEKPKEEEK
jgi:hypothetical protein